MSPPAPLGASRDAFSCPYLTPQLGRHERISTMWGPTCRGPGGNLVGAPATKGEPDPERTGMDLLSQDVFEGSANGGLECGDHSTNLLLAIVVSEAGKFEARHFLASGADLRDQDVPTGGSCMRRCMCVVAMYVRRGATHQQDPARMTGDLGVDPVPPPPPLLLEHRNCASLASRRPSAAPCAPSPRQ
jgi:hypothetical protein